MLFLLFSRFIIIPTYISLPPVIDGIDIKDIKLGSLRKNIGYVSQDIFLFSDTIRENIRFGRRNATDKEIEEAATIAGADEFIQRSPEGSSLYVGDLKSGIYILKDANSKIRKFILIK